MVTDRVAPCKCGWLPGVRGQQDPFELVWRFFVSCFHCGDGERGSHLSVHDAVMAWNKAHQ